MRVTSSSMTFQNPILAPGQDPWVIRHQENYYLIQAVNEPIATIVIRVSPRLSQLGHAEVRQVWQAPTDTMYSQQIWAPELHYLEGHWYIYYAASDGNNLNHRMYVLASQTNNPLGPYEHLGKLNDQEADYWAIDGTVLQRNGKLYFIWSGWPTEYSYFPQNLYVALLKNPCTISGSRVLLSTPEYDWEKTVAAVNEAPQILQSNGHIFLVYSADASWGPQKLGLMTFSGQEVLRSDSWKKLSSPVFQQSSPSAYGPGHPSFVKSPDNSEDWIVYHARQNAFFGWERDIRIQQFAWRTDGMPFFGFPSTIGEHLLCPAGEGTFFVNTPSPVKTR